MSRGCLIALVTFGVCFFLLLVLVVVVPLFVFDIIDSAPRVPVSAFLTEHTVAAVTVDPNHKQLVQMLDQSGSGFGWFLPHELGSVVDLDPAGKNRTLTIVGSPKHLGPLIMMWLGNSEMFPASAMETRGIDTWLTPALTREKGAIILRGTGAVEAQSEELAAAHWPTGVPWTPVTFEGGHAVELVIHNQGGAGIRALEPFFRIDPTAVDASAATPDAADQGVPEADAKQPAEAVEATPENQKAQPTDAAATDASAQPAGAAPKAAPEPSAAGFLEYASDLRLLGDFTEAGDFKLALTAQAKDAEKAALAKTLLDGLRELIRTEMAKEGITVAGETTVSGNTVAGAIVYSGYQERFAKWLREMQQSRY